MGLHFKFTSVPEYTELSGKERGKMFRAFKSKFMGTPAGIACLLLPTLGMAFGIGIVKIIGLPGQTPMGIGAIAGLFLTVAFVPFILSYGFASFIRGEQRKQAEMEERRARRDARRSMTEPAPVEEDNFVEPVLGSTPDHGMFA